MSLTIDGSCAELTQLQEGEISFEISTFIFLFLNFHHRFENVSAFTAISGQIEAIGAWQAYLRISGVAITNNGRKTIKI